jgi:hypothetical protein
LQLTNNRRFLSNQWRVSVIAIDSIAGDVKFTLWMNISARIAKFTDREGLARQRGMVENAICVCTSRIILAALL